MRRIHLRRLFASLIRADDEFEGISVLILFHQLQVNKPFRAFERIAGGKLWLRGFDQLGRKAHICRLRRGARRLRQFAPPKARGSQRGVLRDPFDSGEAVMPLEDVAEGQAAFAMWGMGVTALMR